MLVRSGYLFCAAAFGVCCAVSVARGYSVAAVVCLAMFFMSAIRAGSV